MSFSSDQPLLTNQLSTNVEFDNSKPEFNAILNLAYRRIVDAMNTKEGSLYLLQELATFKQIYNLTPQLGVYSLSVNRNVYRRTWDLIEEFGANIPNATTVTFSHGISSPVDAVLIYASVTTNAANNPRFTITGTDATIQDVNVVFTNNTGSTITQGMFVAEYTKN